MPAVPAPIDTRPTQIVETPISSILAERTLAKLAVFMDLDPDGFDNKDEMVEIINLALLEAQADHILHNCTELTLTGVEPRFTGEAGTGQKAHEIPANAQVTLLGPLPPVGTLWINPHGTKYFIASHRSL